MQLVDPDFCSFEFIKACIELDEPDVRDAWFALRWHLHALVAGSPPARDPEIAQRRRSVWSFCYDVRHIAKSAGFLLSHFPGLLWGKALCWLVSRTEGACW